MVFLLQSDSLYTSYSLDLCDNWRNIHSCWDHRLLHFYSIRSLEEDTAGQNSLAVTYTITEPTQFASNWFKINLHHFFNLCPSISQGHSKLVRSWAILFCTSGHQELKKCYNWVRKSNDQSALLSLLILNYILNETDGMIEERLKLRIICEMQIYCSFWLKSRT